MKSIMVWGILFWVCALVSAQEKYALVIGNAGYKSALQNPRNDANDMEAALKTLGWTVEKVLDGNRIAMQNGVSRLKDRLKKSRNSYGFFFYAGHGVQSKDTNYLIPVDADIPSENYLGERAMSVQVLLEELHDAGNELNVVILDACRNNPFNWARSGTRGLKTITVMPQNAIVVFATGANSLADDNPGERNGLFTAHFLTNLKKPGIEVAELFQQTGGAVARASGNKQRPEMHSAYYEKAYLGTKPGDTPSPAPPTPPSGGFVRIQGGTFSMGSPSSEPGRDSDEGPQHRVTVDSFYMGKYEVTQGEYEEVMGRNPSYFKGDNLPVEEVSWYDAIDYCNKRSAREGLSPAYTRKGNDVTWNRGANGYRLPTEAEWEYACRAGTTTPFSTGNNITTSQANYDGNYPYNGNPKGTYREKTTEVGSFSPNPWGLYDMHGNVWEWCWDRYGSYSGDAQKNPVGPSAGADRVRRGGSWGNDGVLLRSAVRASFTPTIRGSLVGFRLVRP